MKLTDRSTERYKQTWLSERGMNLSMLRDVNYDTEEKFVELWKLHSCLFDISSRDYHTE